MAISLPSPRVLDSEYRNWLRAGLALVYLKEGLQSFIENEVYSMHTDIVQQLYGGPVKPLTRCSVCNSCSVKQNKLTGIWELGSQCPYRICDIWLNKLLLLHNTPTSYKIYWSNSDATAWPFDPWECAKVYMPKGQPTSNTGSTESNVQALVTLLTNCKHFQRKLSLSGPYLANKIAREIEEVIHDPNMGLSDRATQVLMLNIMDFLQEVNLYVREECKTAFSKIYKIHTEPLDNFNLDQEVNVLKEYRKHLVLELSGLGIELDDVTETDASVQYLKEEIQNLLKTFYKYKETNDTAKDSKKRMAKFEQELNRRGKAETGKLEVSLKSVIIHEVDNKPELDRRPLVRRMLEEASVQRLAKSQQDKSIVADEHTLLTIKTGLLQIGSESGNSRPQINKLESDYIVKGNVRKVRAKQTQVDDSQQRPTATEVSTSFDIETVDRSSLGSQCLRGLLKEKETQEVHNTCSSEQVNIAQKILKVLHENTDPNITKQVLLYLSKQLSKQLKQVLEKVDFVVWPGVNLADGKTIFVCIYKGTIEKTPRRFYGITIFYKDCEKPTRNTKFPNKDLLPDADGGSLKYEDATLVERAIQEHGDFLFSKHSNLEAITGSPFVLSRSQGIVQRKCVVLYCQVKGIVPYGEALFPTTLQVGDTSLHVDVCEGYFRQGMLQQNIAGRTDWHDQLRMGISIGVKEQDLAGTLGPFVKLKGKGVGFLTCAHVVEREKRKVFQPADGESSLEKPNTERYCGKVLKVVFKSEFQDRRNGLSDTVDVGVDAALVEIKGNRTFDPLNFPTIPKTDLHKAGFDLSNPPSFVHGSVKCFPTFQDIQGKRVIKCGRTTGLTKGSLQLKGAQIKRKDANMLLPNSSSSVIMKGQFIVERHGRTPFFELGDSGAGVFVVNKENQLTCIGLAIGELNEFRSVVTPIEYVLKALGLKTTDLKFDEEMDTTDLKFEEDMDTTVVDNVVLHGVE